MKITSHWSREHDLNSNGRDVFSFVYGGAACGRVALVLHFIIFFENRLVFPLRNFCLPSIQVYIYPIVVSVMLYANNCVGPLVLCTRSSSYGEFYAPHFYRISTEIIKSEPFRTILMYILSDPYPVFRNCRIQILKKNHCSRNLPLVF